MVKNIKELVFDLLKVIFIIVILYVVYQVFRAIIGGTWETENIILASLGIIMAGMFVIVGFLINQAKSIGILEERTINIGNSLRNLGSDFKQYVLEKGRK